MDLEDTITAVASAPGASSRGIIRISGPTCRQCLESSFQFADDQQFRSAQAPLVLTAELKLAENQSLPGSLIYWPDQRSYTRQPTAEFHTFGSPPLLKLALSIICQSGARLAQPGEFTLRAFLSGRLDLTQAEAVLAIIDADGEAEFQGALNQLAGGLAGPLQVAREQLLFLLAELEAGLDFVEEDIEFISRDELQRRLLQISQTMDSIVQQIGSRELESGVAQVALIGLPNVGKSSLFNGLLNSPRAIVTPVAGTTTDFLTANLELSGQQIELVDTAGKESTEQVDTVMERAQQYRDHIDQSAAIRVLCIDFSRPITEWEQNQLRRVDENRIVVQTKSDLGCDPSNRSTIEQLNQIAPFVITSAMDLTGLDELESAIQLAVQQLNPAHAEIVGATVQRAADSLLAAGHSIDLAVQAVSDGAGEELVAVEIRQALEELGQVVGTVYTDDILDIVFSRFCIGK